MYDDANWIILTDDEAAEILKTASPVDDKYETSATTTKVEKRSLPFYNDTRLIRLTDPSWGNEKLAFFYLLKDTTLYCVFRTIRPVIPATSGHLNRGIRPPLYSGCEAL